MINESGARLAAVDVMCEPACEPMSESASAALESPEPFGNVGPSVEPDAVCSCGATSRSTRHPDRCAKGHPLVGQPGPALVVGDRSRVFWKLHNQARRELRDEIIADAGHSAAAAPRALILAAESIAQAVLIRDSAYLRMAEAGGPLASSGRVRRAFAVWSAAADRLEKHLRLVGLRRLPKPALNVAEYLAQRRAETTIGAENSPTHSEPQE